MIVAAVINFLLTTLVVPIINLFPNGSSLGLNTAAQAIGGSVVWKYIGWANDYLPMTTLLTIIGIMVTLATATAAIQVGLWLYHQFWGGN